MGPPPQTLEPTTTPTSNLVDPIPTGVTLLRDSSDCVSQINPLNHPDRFKCTLELTAFSNEPGGHDNTEVTLVGFEGCVIDVQPVTWAWRGESFIFQSSASLDMINDCFVVGQLITAAGASPTPAAPAVAPNLSVPTAAPSTWPSSENDTIPTGVTLLRDS